METVYIIILILLVLSVILYMMIRRQSRSKTSSPNKWTSEQKANLKALLLQRPIISCSDEHYKAILDCIMNKFVDVFEYNNTMRQLSQPLTPTIQGIIGSCMNHDCLVDVLMQEHPNLPLNVATCMVNFAMTESHNLPIVAIRLLHNESKLAEYVLKCANQ
jgi:hypothetical protein